MWRPNPRNSQWIVCRQVTTDWSKTDNKGNPTQTEANVKVYAEVYSGINPVTRQAFGIQQEEALTVQMSGKILKNGDLLVIGGKIYRPLSISCNDPVQVIAVYTGKENGK